MTEHAMTKVAIATPLETGSPKESTAAMTRFSAVSAHALGLAIAGLVALGGISAKAQTAKAKPASALGNFGGNSKDPIKIDADKLEVFDKESRAVYSGNVVAVQTDTTVRCATMIIFYTGRSQPGARAAAPAEPAAGTSDSSIKRIECTGPVTVVSKTQTATGNHAVFNRENNTVIMTGNVALADGPNITRGEKLVYNTETGIANVDTKPGGRVQGFFVPGSDDSSKPGADKRKPGQAKPATN
jgi:lipopolysaccharide export system protein LptA